jgi:hypothetical protein
VAIELLRDEKRKSDEAGDFGQTGVEKLRLTVHQVDVACGRTPFTRKEMGEQARQWTISTLLL